MTRDYLKKISEFPVGTPFSSKDFDGETIYGWVTGYSRNVFGEILFMVEWIDGSSDKTIHPSKVYNILEFSE